RAGPGPVRDAWLASARALMPAGSPWRRMPVQIEDERLLGGLDLAAAIGSGQRILQRGLLAEAHGGAVIAPMAERLSSGTAARLAGALDDGVVTVARDGMTERLPAGFVLLALDEGAGDERPPAALAERLAFLIDLEGVSYRDALPISATAEDILEARVALTRIDAPGAAAVEALIAAAQGLGIDSLRPPLQALRTACALAALEGRTEVDQEDLGVAARLVLAPRATRIPALNRRPSRKSPKTRASRRSRRPIVRSRLTTRPGVMIFPKRSMIWCWKQPDRPCRRASRRSGYPGARPMPPRHRGRRAPAQDRCPC
ncbi:MAG: hypothetical protein EBS42_15630, partial [Caulobacteraceae bacterium]|nr:hypothetical protein [Caulobacteraceae bacterium]